MTRPRVARLALLALVIGVGTLYRLDALTLIYGPVQGPAWLRAVQQSRVTDSALRPDTFRWERWQGRYISDPYTYLQYAREMRTFYRAHRREPVFPFATRISLGLLGNQDIAVSFASMFFSVLAIPLTYLLGRAAFGGWVGLGAAAALAIEYDAITWGVGGWRDDAFTCAVMLSAYALLRMMWAPSWRTGVVLGAVASAACLTRITSLSFLLPGAAYAWYATPVRWKAAIRPLAAAIAVAVLLTGPYLLNCWRTFGDPLYAINVHAGVYRAAEGQPADSSGSAGDFVLGALTQRPWQTLDSVVQGLTTYPFRNKWTGFDHWHGWLGTVLSCAALLGLVLFTDSSQGRLLLVVLTASLVPYALTWKLIFDWRFTQHAYPFFLIAAAYAVDQAARGLTRRRQPDRDDDVRPVRVRARWWSAAVAGGLAVAAIMMWIVPPGLAAEALRAGESVSIGPGNRDRIYFRDGWSPAVQQGNVLARITGSRVGRIRLPLPDVRAYDMTLRMDPHSPPQADAPLTQVRVVLNDQLVGIVELQWNPERVGAYRLRVPAAAVRAGRNELALIPSDREGRPVHLRFWYVRIGPAPTV